jgi:eukaryotic-like serine/threonine-protein kinase
MKKVGRYIVRGLLGRGAMGKVFKVELPPIGKIGALKLLAPDPLLNQLMGYHRIRDLFINEAVTAAGLRHPNIIAIHDFDEAQGKPFFVMDFYANNLGSLMGETYRIEKPSRALSADKALDYLDQTLSGLGCLHDAGILHRDIKPFNLLITDQDTVKICDFGLSILRGERFGGPANLNVGSPYYAAPEQETDPDSIDFRADLYPLGIMFYRMLTGYLPDLEGELSAYLPPSRRNPNLDPHWDQFTARAMARHPDQRFSCAREMRTALACLRDHWELQKEKYCTLIPAPTELSHGATASAHLTPRSRPIKRRPEKAAEEMNLDSLYRPQTYSVNRFKQEVKDTITDDLTGLIWQQSGSIYPRTWSQAHDYVARLNAQRFSGLHNWHLPTIDELITLLKPASQGQAMCIEPLFDTTQRWIWSSDRRTFIAAYFVDIELGFVGWQDISAPFYVRAVCSPGQRHSRA